MEKKSVIIPTGYFESNCESCTSGYNDPDGLYCAMYRRTIMPGEMDNEKCPQYKMRLKEKIKIGIFVFFMLGILEMIVAFIKG